MVRGYSGLVADKAAYGGALEYYAGFLSVFVDVGRFDTQQAVGDWVGSGGITFGTAVYRVHLPLYISDPALGGRWVAHNTVRDRVYLSLNLRNIRIGLR
jgi:hypothetical protein